MDTRSISRTSSIESEHTRIGAITRLLTAAGAAVAIAAAAPGVALAQSAGNQYYNDQDVPHRYQTTDDQMLDDEFWGDDSGVGFDQQTYGEVNYERSKGYGDFSYYSDQPPGRYTYQGATPMPDRRYGQDRQFTLDDGQSQDWRSQQRTVRMQDRSDYGGMYEHGGMDEQRGTYGDSGFYGDAYSRGHLPRANVRLHGMNVSRQDQGLSARYQQTGQFEQRRAPQASYYTTGDTDTGDFFADDYDARDGRALSYGDVNYEESLGYGEFSYYSDQPPGRYEYPDASRPYDPTTGRYEPAGYRDADWQTDDREFDDWYDNGR